MGKHSLSVTVASIGECAITQSYDDSSGRPQPQSVVLDMDFIARVRAAFDGLPRDVAQGDVVKAVIAEMDDESMTVIDVELAISYLITNGTIMFLAVAGASA